MSVQVRLITREEQFRVDDRPLYVPVDLKRYGLSEIVNQLLGTAEPIPFEFLIDGRLLRSSLEEYLGAHNLSKEIVITLEYTRGLLPPRYSASFMNDDWISSVYIDENGGIFSGSYDGVIRQWNQSGEVENELAGHSAAVKDVKVLGDCIISASADRTLKLWINDEVKCTLVGHSAAVNAISIVGSNIISASSDKSLRLWTTNYENLPSALHDDTSESHSRKTSQMTLNGHSAQVTGVAPHSVDRDVIYSCSEDHNLNTWDLVTGTLVESKNLSASLLCITNLGPTINLVACGSTDRHITLVDPRADYNTSFNRLSGHKNFVVDLAANPANAHQFVSASHDGTLRVWDVRSTKSLSVLKRQTETDNDIYAVDWGQFIVSGGRDKKIEIYQVTEE